MKINLNQRLFRGPDAVESLLNGLVAEKADVRKPDAVPLESHVEAQGSKQDQRQDTDTQWEEAKAGKDEDHNPDQPGDAVDQKGACHTDRIGESLVLDLESDDEFTDKDGRKGGDSAENLDRKPDEKSKGLEDRAESHMLETQRHIGYPRSLSGLLELQRCRQLGNIDVRQHLLVILQPFIKA